MATIEDLEDTTYTVWLSREIYFWHVKASNLCDKESSYQSQPFSFYVFQSGDATNEGVVNGADVVHTINYLYREGPEPSPFESGDTSCGGAVDASDIVWLIGYLFRGGSSPCCF